MPLAGALYARETPVTPPDLGYLISPEGFDCFAQDEKNPRMGEGAVGRGSGFGFGDLPPRVCVLWSGRQYRSGLPGGPVGVLPGGVVLAWLRCIHAAQTISGLVRGAKTGGGMSIAPPFSMVFFRELWQLAHRLASSPVKNATRSPRCGSM